MRNTLRILALLLLCASLCGCLSSARPGAMVPGDFAPGKRFNKSVSISVAGGPTTNVMGTPLISNEGFAKAIQTTIEKTGLFSSVLQSGGADYQLAVRLMYLNQAFAYFECDVRAGIEWRLRQASSGKLVWEQTIERSYTTTLGDTMVGAKRIKLGNEGAIRESIKAGLERISTLSL